MNTYKDKWQEVPSSLNKPMDVLDLGPPYFFKQTTLFSGFVSAYAFFLVLCSVAIFKKCMSLNVWSVRRLITEQFRY